MKIESWLKRNATLLTALIVSVVFLVVQSVMMINGLYYASLVPALCLVLMLFILRFETGLMVMALLTPFAVDFALLPGMELSMPVEPMMILFSGIFIFRALIGRNYDLRILRHPVSLAVVASLLWMLFTSATSQMPEVSFKYFAARLWFVLPFFFASAQVFSNTKRIHQFYWCYAFSLVVVILISTGKTLGDFHDLQTLHRVMRPFYNDHTAYGCVIALFFPAVLHYLFSAESKGWRRLLCLAALAAFGTGLFLSYSRAAWISVLAAGVLYVAIRMGVKVRWLLIFFVVFISAFFVYQTEVMYNLGKNKQDSAYDLADQVKSISNISTDASNLERLNRWASAMRMFQESPVVGCGPGTYQFLYASYQRSYQLSVISTNSGDRGNAHSEYIGPLTEQGIPGTIIVLCLFLATFATGVRVYRTARDPRVARLALTFTLCLLTYYIHGMFNNFLDTDKLSVPFWGFTAAVVALDVFSEKREDA